MAILGDLAGPKIRIGALPGVVDLDAVGQVVIAPEASAHGDELPTTYADLAMDVTAGNRILLDDGLMELRVDAVVGDHVDRIRRILVGGQAVILRRRVAVLHACDRQRDGGGIGIAAVSRLVDETVGAAVVG